MELRTISTIFCAVIAVNLGRCFSDAQPVTLAVQLQNMQGEIDQLRSDVDTLMAQVRELRGQAGLASTPAPPVDPADFIYAHCRLLPNAAIERNLYEPIVGDIDFKQNASGGPISIRMNLYGFRTPNSLHGMHVHTYGDLRRGCGSTGGHYKPRGYDHGGPNDQVRHIGDFGNIQVDDRGSLSTEITDNVATLVGEYSILGRTILIHAGKDDLGRGGDAGSRGSGNAGARLGCCVIGLSDGEVWQQ